MGCRLSASPWPIRHRQTCSGTTGAEFNKLPLVTTRSSYARRQKVVQDDATITRMVSIIYEVNGLQHKAEPISAQESAALGLDASCSGGDPCSGDYKCESGVRYRCMLN